jgi:hypothetical protein
MMGMAKSRTRKPSEATVDAVTEDNVLADLEVAPEPAAKTPTPVRLTPDRTPQITIHGFVRGSKDPILHAFAHHEKLTSGTRKLTRAQWGAEYEAFKGAGR